MKNEKKRELRKPTKKAAQQQDADQSINLNQKKVYFQEIREELDKLKAEQLLTENFITLKKQQVVSFLKVDSMEQVNEMIGFYDEYWNEEKVDALDLNGELRTLLADLLFGGIMVRVDILGRIEYLEWILNDMSGERPNLYYSDQEEAERIEVGLDDHDALEKIAGTITEEEIGKIMADWEARGKLAFELQARYLFFIGPKKNSGSFEDIDL